MSWMASAEQKTLLVLRHGVVDTVRSGWAKLWWRLNTQAVGCGITQQKTFPVVSLTLCCSHGDVRQSRVTTARSPVMFTVSLSRALALGVFALQNMIPFVPSCLHMLSSLQQVLPPAAFVGCYVNIILICFNFVSFFLLFLFFVFVRSFYSQLKRSFH